MKNPDAMNGTLLIGAWMSIPAIAAMQREVSPRKLRAAGFFMPSAFLQLLRT